MRSLQRIHLIYFFSLITVLVCAACAPQQKPVPVVEPAPKIEQPVEEVVEEYTDSNYEEGDEAYPAGYYIHTVSVPSENISIIAKWYTEEQKNWVVLVKCNPTIKPNRIFLGDKIRIPRSIMTRHTALPADFVHQSHAKVKKKTTPKAPVIPQIQSKKQVVQPAAEEKTTKPAVEEPLFFGPKEY